MINEDVNREKIATRNEMCKIEEELKAELQIKKEDLEKRMDELERVRCQNVAILERLEKLEELNGKTRLEAAKKEEELEGC